ncbi:hypothetical protein LUZ60_008088 [Juncus effusus]|nr:hypothetical protein LUZ60_008088 [Juncus effusus]
MSSLFYLFSTLFFIVSSSHFSLVQGSKLHGFGVNYGTLGDNLPVPKESVRLIRKLNVGSVKIYDANSTILSALAGTGILVSIMVPNEIIPTIAANQSAADTWIISNVLPHYKSTKIKFLLVGNEILSDYSMKDSTWPVLVPAMKRLHRSLQTYKISNIKISTTLATDAISLSFRAPSSGSFRPDISSSVILPFLNFLNKTKSYYFVDAYPYFTWSQNYSTIPLNYALFQADPSSYYTDPITKSAYTNLLDETLDSVIFAMQKLGFCDVKLGIAETGWPNGGDLDQIGMNVYNAATYNRNLVKRMAQKLGTPS